MIIVAVTQMEGIFDGEPLVQIFDVENLGRANMVQNILSEFSKSHRSINGTLTQHGFKNKVGVGEVQHWEEFTVVVKSVEQNGLQQHL